MKNFLSNLWSLVAGSQRNDVEFDRRLTVGSPSGFTINWTLKLVSVLVLVLSLCSGNAWGATVTFTAGTDTGSGSVKKDGITISMSTMDRADNYRCNSGTTISFSSSVGNITKIELTCTGSGTNNYGPGKLSSWSNYSYSGNTGTWTGNSSSVTSANSSAQVRITSIVVTYTPSCSTKPTVGSSLTSMSATANSITATIPISAVGGCNITENGLVYSTTAPTPTVGGTGCTKVTTTACGSTAANKTVTIPDLTCGTSYYVRGYATNAAGTSYTNVTTQSTSACPLYTITLMDDSDTRTQASAGASVTLPSRTSCTGYTFAGWTKTWVAEQSSWTTTAPTIIPAGSYTPTANENLYPVYTKTEGGEEEETEIFATTSLGSTNTVTTGYAVSAAAEAKSGYYQDGSGTTRSVSVSKSSTATAMISSIPTIATVTATLGGGSAKDPLTNNVYAVWLDASGNELGDAVQITSKITNTTGSDFTANLPVANATSAYGVRIKHQKETSYNVRYYAISLSITTGGSTTYYISVPGCCSAPGTALSITSANSVATGGTVSLTSTGGNGGTVTWSVVNGSGTATIAGTTLTAGSVGTVTVKAHQDATGGYCAQDDEQTFTIVSSTVNVTSVSVDPTSKAIVVGETFTITPTVLPANATDKSVSWSSSASGKASVSSGTVTGVAAGSATITCETTDGGFKATTAVTVYGVTMQALDEDGNAIAVGGPGTPSRTGASISPAADAGNYVFKEWAISGASLGSSASTKANTITNPTGAVTVTAKYYKPRTVKWSVNGNDSYNTGGPTTTVAYNGTISTVPTDPSGLACASTFVAWTDAAHNNGQTAKASDSYYGSALYTAAGEFPNITAETTTFYAVFAEGSGAAVNTVMWSEDWTSASNNAKPSQTTGEGTTVYGGGSVTYTESGSDCKIASSDSYAGGTAPELFFSGTQWWNIANIPTGGAATLSLSFKTNQSGRLTVTTTTGNVSIDTRSGSNPYTHTITIGSGVSKFDLKFSSSNNARLDNIDVKVASVSLINYVTECDANIVKVTYNANGGSTSCTNTTTDKTEDFTVCSTPPTRDYYTFAGWLCSADSKTYAASATIDDAVIDADFTLTAQWTPVTYNITYELDGGTNNVGNPATYNVTTATITLQDPTKGHDRFDGWFTDDGVWSDEVTEIPLGSHGDITLYAKWTERHEIVFDYSEGDGGTTTTIYRADDEDLSASVAGQGSVPSDPSAPTACSSKVFVGWSESTIDGETDTEPGDLMKPAAGTVDADKHYYAVWANESSESGTVTVFSDDLSVDGDSDDPVSSRSGWTDLSSVYTNNGDGVRVSAKSSAGSMTIDLSDKSLESTITLSMQVKRYGSDDSYLGLSCMDEGTTASFSPTSFTTTSSSWEDKSCTITNVNAATQSITLSGSTSSKRIYIRKVKVTQTGTVYTYSAYSTSCCATKVTLSDPSITGTGATITFDKVSPVATCNGSKIVTATVTVTAGYQVTELSFSGGSVNVSPAISTPITSTTNYTLTFGEGTNATLTTTATAGAKPLNSITITPSSGEVYVGQYVDFTVSYDPADYISTGYTLNATPVYVNKESAAPANTKLRLKGGRGSGPGASITETVNETVTIKASGDNTKTASVNMTVNPLPRVHFVDLVHGKAFADVVATIAENALNPNKTTKTSVDWVTPNANTCEENHLHLVGWIREDWPALVAYLNGTGDAPATTAIVGAGNDGSGNAYYIAAGASINVQTFDGVTFYAVWAEIK